MLLDLTVFFEKISRCVDDPAVPEEIVRFFQRGLILFGYLPDACFEIFFPYEFAGDEGAVSFFDDPNTVDRSDLAKYRLYVLIVYRDALRAVDFLDGVQKIVLDRLEPFNFQKLLRIYVSLGEDHPLCYRAAFLDA